MDFPLHTEGEFPQGWNFRRDGISPGMGSWLSPALCHLHCPRSGHREVPEPCSCRNPAQLSLAGPKATQELQRAGESSDTPRDLELSWVETRGATEVPAALGARRCHRDLAGTRRNYLRNLLLAPQGDVQEFKGFSLFNQAAPLLLKKCRIAPFL